MPSRTLLERVLYTGTAVSATVDTVAVTESVVANLRHIFNSRQGCSTSRPDFGMPEFADLMHGFPHIIPELLRAIRYQIEQFEPRLVGVQVRHRTDSDNPAAVRFLIRATLMADGDESPLTLDGALGADGHLDVRS